MMDLQKEIEKLKVKAGYDGKPQQWQYGFDLACRELAKAQAVPEGFVLVPREPTNAMLFAASGRDIVAEHYGDENILWPELRETWKAMIEAQEPSNNVAPDLH